MSLLTHILSPDLQKSPATSTRVSVRIVVQPPGAAGPENHDFRFTSPTAAKAEQEAMVDALSKIISSLRAGTGPPAAKPGTGAPTDNTGQSAAMAIAQAVSAGARAAEDDQYSDARLFADVGLQRSLLNSSPELKRRFNEAHMNKPSTIMTSQFSAEFWSSRVHLLRAHAIEKSQRQGAYNVLSEIKTKDGKLNLSREQIQLIFNQHPLVRRVYNETVPKAFSESDFWSKFFVSRLFKKLKGEKITDMDASIAELDKYLTADDEPERLRQFNISHIPRFIDLEGNEQNHSQRKGNAPDYTLRPNSLEKVPILRVLNNMSEQMIGNVEPADEAAFAPVGMSEDTFKKLEDKFLQNAADDNRIMLKIKDRQKFFSKEKDQERRPSKVLRFDNILQRIEQDLNRPRPLFINFEENDEQAANEAAKSITKRIKQRVERLSAGTEVKINLSPQVTNSATMTHNTTIEFLHYFWTVFLSGDDTRTGELQNLIDTLEKSLERINAVAEQAEGERTEGLKQIQQQEDEWFKRTAKRRKLDTSRVGGGKQTVQDLLRATVRAVKFADTEYKKALQEQMSQYAIAVG